MLIFPLGKKSKNNNFKAKTLKFQTQIWSNFEEICRLFRLRKCIFFSIKINKCCVCHDFKFFIEKICIFRTYKVLIFFFWNLTKNIFHTKLWNFSLKMIIFKIFLRWKISQKNKMENWEYLVIGHNSSFLVSKSVEMNSLFIISNGTIIKVLFLSNFRILGYFSSNPMFLQFYLRIMKFVVNFKKSLLGPVGSNPLRKIPPKTKF